MWCADIEKWVADLAVEGLLFVKVSTKLEIHSLLTVSAADPLAWSEIDPAHRAFDARRPTKPNFQRPDRAGQRCKCRLVCEWVCTVTSVSVRIEKRANCAKNNKPKSGGLFLVNARPFPEHSSSRATFSAGRAWLEATVTPYPHSGPSLFLVFSSSFCQPVFLSLTVSFFLFLFSTKDRT